MSKITIDHSVLEKALQALESMAKTLAEHEDQTTFNEDEAMKALREALAQPQQEPVAVYQVKQSIGESVWCDVSKAEFDASVYFGVTKRAVYTSPPAREPLTHGDLDLCRQWFGCIQDTNPSYIGRNDCALAAKLYTRLGLPIPKELQGFSANGIKDTP